MENPAFFEQDFIVQKEQLIEMAKAKAEEVKIVETVNPFAGLLNA